MIAVMVVVVGETAASAAGAGRVAASPSTSSPAPRSVTTRALRRFHLRGRPGSENRVSASPIGPLRSLLRAYVSRAPVTRLLQVNKSLPGVQKWKLPAS